MRDKERGEQANRGAYTLRKRQRERQNRNRRAY